MQCSLYHCSPVCCDNMGGNFALTIESCQAEPGGETKEPVGGGDDCHGPYAA